MVGVMETSCKRIYANSSQDCCSQYPKTHGRPLSTHSSTRETPMHTQAILVQSLVGSLLLFPGFWCTQGFVPSRSLFPVEVL